nr:G-type lectin S-receptor-like serine/threonine-protein kinase At5g24080 isoform X1 [Tanacetum cinerariifolium]
MIKTRFDAISERVGGVFERGTNEIRMITTQSPRREEKLTGFWMKLRSKDRATQNEQPQSRVGLGSRLYANNNQAWVSDNGTFAFGFTPSLDQHDQYQLGIWFADLPGDRTLAWSAYLNAPVTKNAVLELDNTGNLVLTDGRTTAWTSNTSATDIESAQLLENGNL